VHGLFFANQGCCHFVPPHLQLQTITQNLKLNNNSNNNDVPHKTIFISTTNPRTKYFQKQFPLFNPEELKTQLKDGATAIDVSFDKDKTTTQDDFINQVIQIGAQHIYEECHSTGKPLQAIISTSAMSNYELLIHFL
jgi:hypothetical protein